nr:V-type ATP synthase subunit A [Dehalococcoidales bacterium]
MTEQAPQARPLRLTKQTGVIRGINGPVVRAGEAEQVSVGEMVEVGDARLLGEVIRLAGAIATIQVYESTSGLRPGEPIHGTGRLLVAELGPGLIGTIFDGLQRPLEVIERQSGAFIQRGARVNPLDHERRWRFRPLVRAGDEVPGGATLGEVPETATIVHRVLVPPDLSGTVRSVVPEGGYTLDETVVRLATASGESELKMYQHWPIRQARPYRERQLPNVPLITGQRVIDTFFPVAKGGTAALPGGFGTGKTVTQHQLAKWSDADVIVYIGCGERGNEMTDVLVHFPELLDPRSGRPLMERTVLIANTSNMPVAAREASIYTGITLAEYFRDMGYHVAVMADSTSRWAEALREIAGRLEEMPAEEGFPAYLPSRLAGFYERAGRVTALNDREGSVGIIGAVSPPGGTFSEPVTIYTQRFTRCFWGLDRDLASSRHFPAINWTESYSGYVEEVESWWHEQVDPQWRQVR